MVHFFLRVAPYTAAIASHKNKLALHFAAGDGHVEVVRSLLALYPQGARLPSAKGKLPLHFAARWGHLSIAADLIRVYPEGIRKLDWDCSTPLYDASREGQYAMAQYLLPLYPEALLTANLRGEIPLFPAVRSGNLDLVILLLQAWPASANHILQNASNDDNIENWGQDIFELLLRGAAGALHGCTLLQGSEPTMVLLPPDAEVVTALPDQEHPKKKKAPKNQRHTVESIGMIHFGDFDQGSNDASLPPVAPRSKSPILEADGTRSKKRLLMDSFSLTPSFWGERKRTKHFCMDMLSCQSHDLMTCYCCHSRKCADSKKKSFIPLHAALGCKPSTHIARYILSTHPAELHLKDDQDRYPLHIAVTQCQDEDMVQFVLDEILAPFSQAVTMRDIHNRLPLHIAIASQTDIRIITALLHVYPESGIEKCQTNDEWRDRTPLHMACGCDCDLATVYRLLRADPSCVHALR
jgi:ankyrin repeat protein